VGTKPPPRLRLEQHIALQVKREQVNQGLKIADVSRASGISQGMVSKIVNAQVSTSLDTLSRLCDAIGMPLSKVFADFNRADGNAQLVKSGEGLEVVRRGTDKGHTYHLLNYKQGPRKPFEPLLATTHDASEVFPRFSTPAPSSFTCWTGAPNTGTATRCTAWVPATASPSTAKSRTARGG